MLLLPAGQRDRQLHRRSRSVSPFGSNSTRIDRNFDRLRPGMSVTTRIATKDEDHV